jgi:Parkin co-regulated protein
VVAGCAGTKRSKAVGSPFDRTVYGGGEIPGSHPKALDASMRHGGTGFGSATSKVTKKPTPTEFLKGHTGLGGTLLVGGKGDEGAAEGGGAAAAAAAEGGGGGGGPPKAGAHKPRPNPPNTDLRRAYERGDLPLSIFHGVARRIQWSKHVRELDYHAFLPIFFDGLREVDEPFSFVAEEGTYDMLLHGGEDKILPVIPELIVPLRNALNTRDPVIVVRVLKVVQTLVDISPRIGEALVPYYRNFLGLLAMWYSATPTLAGGDGIDYAQQKRKELGALVRETLERLERSGGEDAFINIKYLIPTYESAVVGGS